MCRVCRRARPPRSRVRPGMGNGAECPGGTPCGAKLDKIHTKFAILKFLPDERLKSPCLIIAAPKPAAGGVAGQYGGGIIIAPEYKPAEAVCRSRGARGARPHPRHCVSPPLLKARGKGGQPSAVIGQRSVYTPLLKGYAGQASLRRTSQPSAKKKGTAESAEIRKHENRQGAKDAKGAKTRRGEREPQSLPL